MSLAGYRDTIATALSTVADVKGYQYRPVNPVTGDGWALLGAMDRGPGRSFEVTWRVLVLLPSDERKASEWIDAHHELLVDAMEDLDVGFVDRLEPVELATSGGPLLALQITMRSE